MIIWLSKSKIESLLSLEKGLKGLIEQQELCQERHKQVDRDIDNLDADMSALWDKVNNALARLGGRKSRKSAPEPEDNGRPSDINEQIRMGVFDAGIPT